MTGVERIARVEEDFIEEYVQCSPFEEGHLHPKNLSLLPADVVAADTPLSERDTGVGSRNISTRRD